MYCLQASQAQVCDHSSSSLSFAGVSLYSSRPAQCLGPIVCSVSVLAVSSISRCRRLIHLGSRGRSDGEETEWKEAGRGGVCAFAVPFPVGVVGILPLGIFSARPPRNKSQLPGACCKDAWLLTTFPPDRPPAQVGPAAEVTSRAKYCALSEAVASRQCLATGQLEVHRDSAVI